MVAIGPVVTEEKSFEIVDGRTDDGRATEPAYIISSPGAFGSGELKRKSPEIILNTTMSAAMIFFWLGTQEQVRNSLGKQAISVQATEVLL